MAALALCSIKVVISEVYGRLGDGDDGLVVARGALVVGGSEAVCEL